MATAPARNRTPRRRRKTTRATMAEVAQLAQVSPSTVSLYLRNPGAVSNEAGARIARAVAKLQYVPNLVAGGLAAASSRVVSVIVPSLRNAFFAETVAHLQDGLAARGLQLLLAHSEYSLDQEEALVRIALSWSPAAIVLAGLEHSREARSLLLNASMPVFEIWELGERPIDAAVGFSHVDVGRTAVKFLRARGRERIAFLGARMHVDARARQRAAGCSSVINAQDTPVRVLDSPDPPSPQVGATLIAQLLREDPDIDAVVCSNDHLALGVLFECQRRGVAVPGKLAVVGFGDLPFASQCVPPLTTIRPSGDLIGQRVAALIIERLKDRDSQERHRIDTGFQLIERDSA